VIFSCVIRNFNSLSKKKGKATLLE